MNNLENLKFILSSQKSTFFNKSLNSEQFDNTNFQSYLSNSEQNQKGIYNIYNFQTRIFHQSLMASSKPNFSKVKMKVKSIGYLLAKHCQY